MVEPNVLSMIAYLRGTIIRKTERLLVLDVHGVGYAVHVPSPVLEQLSIGHEITLHIHTSVTESDIVLYGFLSTDECTLFEQLISVSGIGSKTAIEILSRPIGSIRQAIATADYTALIELPGVGRKTAERIVLELKNKIHPAAGTATAAVRMSQVNLEAIEALVALGFSRQEAVSMIALVPADIQTSSEMVQCALQQHR